MDRSFYPLQHNLREGFASDIFSYPGLWTLLSPNGDTEAKFRIVAAGVKWHVTDLGTEFNNPIMSPAKMDFAYKATLKNCSPATLSESIGKQDTRTSAYTMGTEESFQLSTTHEASVNLSISGTASASFYSFIDNIMQVQTNVDELPTACD